MLLSIRNILRYLGMVMILAFYMIAGIHMILEPTPAAVVLARSNFQQLLRSSGAHFSPVEYRKCVQGAGCVYVALSLFILLGVSRSFFSFLLALVTMSHTVVLHVNLDDPMATREEDKIAVATNMAIAGSLLFIAGSGRRSRQFSAARGQVGERAKGASPQEKRRQTGEQRK